MKWKGKGVKLNRPIRIVMLYVGRRAPFPMGTNKLFKSKKMFLTYCFVSFWKMDLYSSSSMYSANPKSTFFRTILQIEMGVRVPEASHQTPSGIDQRRCRSGRSQGNLQPAGQRPTRPWTPSSIHLNPAFDSISECTWCRWISICRLFILHVPN